MNEVPVTSSPSAPSAPGSTRPAGPAKAVMETQGLLEINEKGFGFLRVKERNYQASREDVFVSPNLIRDLKLREGLDVVGTTRQSNKGGLELSEVKTLNGLSHADYVKLPNFQSLTVIDPISQIHFETGPEPISNRIIDMFVPIGRGQRGLIVSPPKSGKTTLLKQMGQAVLKNHPDIHLMVLLVDERPEEVTDFKRSVDKAEIFASSNDEAVKNHCLIARLATEKARRLVEMGKDVVMLLDSLTRVARAFNNYSSDSGRTLSGGLDSRAMEIPRKIFASARKAEEAGSLTILATILVDTGSRMDELIFQEFKGTGNMEFVLDRGLAEKRVFPAVDINKSGTRKEEKLIDQKRLDKIHILRRQLASKNPHESTEALVRAMQKTKSNDEILAMIMG
ncbi:MAG: transcription termination factor Rho [Verrucomicrobiae bacterium]|nr:transcription termination factor Rho [Verrucomicrobiae bacterium]